jgi:hypothetical protein
MIARINCFTGNARTNFNQRGMRSADCGMGTHTTRLSLRVMANLDAAPERRAPARRRLRKITTKAGPMRGAPSDVRYRGGGCQGAPMRECVA